MSVGLAPLFALLAPLSAAALDVTAAPTVEPLEHEGVKGLRATFFVAAPPDQLLDLLWDVKRFREVFPDIHRLSVVKDGGETKDVEFFVDAVLANVSYTLRRTRDARARTITWQSVAGDIKFIRGSWTIKATAEPTISEVVYTSFVDVAVIVPSGLVRDTALKKTGEMAARIRKASADRRAKTDAASTASRPLPHP